MFSPNLIMTITTTGRKTSNEIIDVSRFQAILSLGLFVNAWSRSAILCWVLKFIPRSTKAVLNFEPLHCHSLCWEGGSPFDPDFATFSASITIDTDQYQYHHHLHHHPHHLHHHPHHHHYPHITNQERNNNKTFQEIPSGIPTTTTHLILADNQITRISALGLFNRWWS